MEIERTGLATMDDIDVDEIMNRLAPLVISEEEVEARREQEEAEARAKQAEFESRMGTPDFRALKASGYGRREIEAVLGALQGKEWIAKRNLVFGMLREGGIVMLSGDCGTGKTVMAASISKSYLAHKKTVIYTRATDYFRGLKNTWKKSEKMTEEEYSKQFETVDLLVIDEIQDRSDNSWDNTLLNNVIDHRYSELLPTLVITNLEGDEAIKNIPRSIVSRCMGTAAAVSCGWRSFRS